MKCYCCGQESSRELAYPEGVIYMCGNCDLQWAELFHEYAESPHSMQMSYYMRPESIPSPSAYEPFVDFFSVLGKLRPDARTILDVGCGSGTFLAHCLSKGLDAYGVEPNIEVKSLMPADVARRVTFSLLEDIPQGGEKYDVITFWDSFEHMQDPFQVLDIANRFLAENGVVYLRVNNNRDIYNNVCRVLLRTFEPAGKFLMKSCFNFPTHRWNFSSRSFSWILQKRGWTVAECRIGETPAYRFTANPIIQLVINSMYLVNKSMGWGKIGNYYVIKDGPAHAGPQA